MYCTVSMYPRDNPLDDVEAFAFSLYLVTERNLHCQFYPPLKNIKGIHIAKICKIKIYIAAYRFNIQ